MRSVASECLSVAVTLSIPLGIFLAFPFSALSFKAEDIVRQPARTAFVRLTPQAEGLAVKTARASWQAKADGVRWLKADLVCAELPSDERISVLSLRDRSRPPEPPVVSCRRTPFLPSLKAPPPSPISPGNTTEQPAFPREELLKMN